MCDNRCKPTTQPYSPFLLERARRRTTKEPAMPISIHDSKLSSLYTDLQKQNKTIDDQTVMQLLAAVGDSSSKSFSKLVAELAKPGMTREQQVALIQKGMSASEKKDLAAIVDQGTVPMSPSAKNFIEAVLGRVQSQPGDPLKIVLQGDQKNGIVGLAGPNVTIEAINLTTAPGGRLHNEDTIVIGKTDQYGKFTGKLPDMQEGDIIRMRARDASGKVGAWMDVRVTGMAPADTRNAVVAVFRIGMDAVSGGKVAVTNINSSRQISEPGAKLQFTNLRTGEKTVVTIDDQGQLPANLMLNGKAGDQFSIAATDGKNNKTFSVEAGRVTVPGSPGNPTGVVDLPDPALHKDELDANGKPRFAMKRFTGPLFKDGVDMADVEQGQLGDCYFPSAMAALAKAQPEAIKNMIKDNGDGTYTVTFKKKDWSSGRYVDVPIKVDGDLWVRAWGGPLYGSAGGDKSEKGMELWFPLIEKAYAQWKGSYNAIGNGGMSSQVFQECIGRDAVSKSIEYMGADELWQSIKNAVDNHLPASAGTHGEEEDALYTNTGVYADHSYSIVGYKEKNGERYVTLRNPWGESEPAGNGPNDGVFDLKLADFQKLYETFMTVR
jgi:hypothetical protein